MRESLAGLPDLRGLTIAVTGASGFLGSRLVELLATVCRADVLALVRNACENSGFAHLGSRVSTHEMDLDNQDPRMPDSSVDVLLHTALGTRGTARERWTTTVGGTIAAHRIARLLGARRFVHVSSISVYDLEATTLVTESSPPFPVGENDLGYAAQKLAAERAALTAHGLEAVVVQPSLIYGPRSALWTEAPLRRLPGQYYSLPTGDFGVCNAVFVDDVVSALVRASISPGAAGRRFLVSALQPVTWGAFFDAYRAMVQPAATPGDAIADWERQMFAARTVIDIGLARKVLSYSPAYDLPMGMAATRPWARARGLAL